jgi:hypothetical protein
MNFFGFGMLSLAILVETMTLMLYPLSQVCNLLVRIGNDFNFIVNGTTYPCYYLLIDGVDP